MEYKAKLSYLVMTPRKVRLVADLVRYMKVEEARHQLHFSSKRPARPLLKLLNSAVSNARNIKGEEELDEKNLYIKELRVDEGPIIRRFRPRAMGGVDELQRRTSHVTLIVGELEEQSQNSDNKSQTNNKQKDKEEVKAKAKN